MKYCPECDAEYRDEIEACADCRIPLISAEEYRIRRQEEEQERARMARVEFVPVKVAGTAFEADWFRAALEQEGFKVMVRTFEDTAYDGIYVAQKGWGYIEVPRDDQERAERIVNELEKAFRQGEDQG